MHPPPEVWKPIPGYQGLYDISDQGRVRSWKTHHGRPGPRVLTVGRRKNGGLYLGLTLHGPDKSRYWRVHQLVMLAFAGPCPPGLEVRHLDGDHEHNARTNLAYGTRGQNEHDKVAHGTHTWARKTHCPCNHPYDEENTRVEAGGRRRCIECERARQRKGAAA